MTLESYYFHFFATVSLLAAIGWLVTEVSDRRARRPKSTSQSHHP